MATPNPIRVWESQLALYRRIWRSHVFGQVLQPLLYLLGMGLGVGELVDRGPQTATLLDGATYLAYLAPALLAVTAMMTGGQTSLWELLDGFLWSNQFRAMVATPLSPSDVANGIALWHATRIAIGVVGVAAVLVLFDDTRSVGLLLAIPAAIVTGLAFAMPLSAYSSTRETDNSFPAIMRFVLIPMFLFGGAFYPIDQLPGWTHPIAYATPLWHGVQLCRGAVIGGLGARDVLTHISVISLYAVLGWLLARHTFARRLHA